MDLSSACLSLLGSRVCWTAHHSCLWCEVHWRTFKRSGFPGNWEFECVCVFLVVRKISLIPLKLSQLATRLWFMCVRVRVGKREREKDKRDNSNVRVGMFEGAAARPVQRVSYLCVFVSQMTQASSHQSSCQSRSAAFSFLPASRVDVRSLMLIVVEIEANKSGSDILRSHSQTRTNLQLETDFQNNQKQSVLLSETSVVQNLNPLLGKIFSPSCQVFAGFRTWHEPGIRPSVRGPSHLFSSDLNVLGSKVCAESGLDLRQHEEAWWHDTILYETSGFHHQATKYWI